MKNYLITGVSRGLGYKIAETLLERGGCAVYGVGRSSPECVAPLKSRFGGDRVRYLQFDISEIEKIKTDVFENFVGVDTQLHGLVNNAAIAYDDLLTNLRLDPLMRMFQINVFAAIEFSNRAVRNMLLHSTGGSLVHISSICARRGFKGLSMYAATKGALEAFSANVAREWGSRSIRSNCVAAGFMPTDMSASLTDAQREKIAARTALKREVSVDSVAATVAFLLSDAAASITGQVLSVDSGS